MSRPGPNLHQTTRSNINLAIAPTHAWCCVMSRTEHIMALVREVGHAVNGHGGCVHMHGSMMQPLVLCFTRCWRQRRSCTATTPSALCTAFVCSPLEQDKGEQRRDENKGRKEHPRQTHLRGSFQLTRKTRKGCRQCRLIRDGEALNVW